MKSSLVVGQDLSRRRVFSSWFYLLAWLGLVACALLSATEAYAVIGYKGRQPAYKDPGANPLMAARLAKAYQARRNGVERAVPMMVGQQPIVFILIENAAGGAGFNAQLRDVKLWQARRAEMNLYWKEVSINRLDVSPATETEGTANDGIIGPITVPEMSNVAYDTNIALEFPVIAGAVRVASQYIDFASFDKNNDRSITGDELHLIFIFAGYEASYGYPPTPSNWAHMMPVPGGIPGLVPADADGMILTSYIAQGSMLYGINPPAMATIGTLCHEFGHDIGLPDLYDTDYAGSGGGWNSIGVHSLMDRGSWNSLPGALPGSMPPHVDGYLKSLLGWANETVVDAPADAIFTMPAAEGANTVVRINIPNSQEFFIVENRQHILYDRGIPGTLGGLLILHGDDSIINGLPGFYNMLNANPMNPGLKVEEASGRNRLLIDPYYVGGDDDYYRVGINTTLNETTNPNSNRKNGQSSAVDIFEVSPTGLGMTFKLGSGTPRVGFVKPALSVSEATRRIDFVVNLSRKAANLATVDYAVTGGTAVNGFDYTLNNGTLAFYPGETSKYFSVLINNDTLVENNETVLMALSNVRGGMLGFITSTTLTIVDNDNPFLNLLKPNGGERIVRGARFLATWNSDVAVAGGSVKLELYRDGNFYMPLTGNIPNNGSFNVLFPESLPVGFNYKLAVTSVKDPRISDQSDAVFSIIDGQLVLSSLAINNGAATTSNRQVTLNNKCGSAPSAYMASESAAFSGALWKPYSTSPLFVLTPVDATKRVYFKTKNAAGQESNVLSDTIVLKEALVKPVIQQVSDASAPAHQAYNGPVPTLLAGNLPVYWSLVDGPAGIRINPATGVVAWPNPVLDESPYWVTVRAANKAGYSDSSWWLRVENSEPALGLDCTQLAWTAGGNGDWFSQRLVSHDGVDAARSKPVGNNQKSVLTTTVTGPGVLNFWWKVSSERNYDKLGFYLDDNLVQEISGEEAWVQKSLSVPVGQHTLNWIYARDAVGAAGADAGYLDQMTWTPGLIVSGLSRAGYSVQMMRPLAQIYKDRWCSVRDRMPEIFNGQTFIQTLEADRKSNTGQLFSFTVNQPVTVILAIDSRFAVQPAWAVNWKPLVTRLATSDDSMKLYAMRFPKGKITLGGNCNPGARISDNHMYSVILIPNTPVPLTNLSNATYSALKLHAGLRVFGDFTSVFSDPVSPLFFDQTFIRTRYSDRNSVVQNFLNFEVSQPVTVILAMDSRITTPPTWAAGWQVMADPLKASTHSKKLYVKRFQPGRVSLGGNLTPGQTTSYNMYTVLVLPSN